MKKPSVFPLALFLIALAGATSLLVAAGLAEPVAVQVSAVPAR